MRDPVALPQSGGATEEEAIENVKDAIAEWPTARRALGLPIEGVRFANPFRPGFDLHTVVSV